MKRTFLVAGLAVAVLFGVSIGVLLLLTREPGSTAPVLGDSGPQPAASADGTPPPVESPAPPPLATAPPARAPAWRDPIVTVPRWKAPAQEAPTSLVASRVIRKRVLHALQARLVQSRLARCVDTDVGFGGAAAQAPIPRGKPAVLLLELEAPGGEVRIVDAQVRDWGGASESTVSCARNALRGEVIAAPTIPRGERTWMPFPLNPRSEAVAASR